MNPNAPTWTPNPNANAWVPPVSPRLAPKVLTPIRLPQPPPGGAMPTCFGLPPAAVVEPRAGRKSAGRGKMPVEKTGPAERTTNGAAAKSNGRAKNPASNGRAKQPSNGRAKQPTNGRAKKHTNVAEPTKNGAAPAAEETTNGSKNKTPAERASAKADEGDETAAPETRGDALPATAAPETRGEALPETAAAPETKGVNALPETIPPVSDAEAPAAPETKGVNALPETIPPVSDAEAPAEPETKGVNALPETTPPPVSDAEAPAAPEAQGEALPETTPPPETKGVNALPETTPPPASDAEAPATPPPAAETPPPPPPDGLEAAAKRPPPVGGPTEEEEAAGDGTARRVEKSREKEVWSSSTKAPQQQPRPEEFVMEVEIGVGAFGRVTKVLHTPSRRYYAMKTISKKVLRRKKISQAEWRLERDVLVKIEPHPYVVELVCAFQTVASFYLVMSYLPGGELFQFLRKNGTFPEDVAAFYAAEVALALEHLHANGVIHRDLKPENLLMDADGHVVVTDFGLAKMFQSHDEVHRTLCGTDEYMAPEMVARRSYSYAVDLWSLGVLIYEMVTGKAPFTAKDTKDLHRKILQEKVKFPQFLDATTITCLRGLLERQVPKRLGAAKATMFQVGGFDGLKKHAFFRRIEWQPLARRESPAPLAVSRIEDRPDFASLPRLNKRCQADDAFSETTANYSDDAQSTVADFEFCRSGAFEFVFADDSQGMLSPPFTEDSFSKSGVKSGVGLENDARSRSASRSHRPLESPTSSQCDVSSSCASLSSLSLSNGFASNKPKKPRPPRKRKKKPQTPFSGAGQHNATTGGQKEIPPNVPPIPDPSLPDGSQRSTVLDRRLESIPDSPHLQPTGAHPTPDLAHLAALGPAFLGPGGGGHALPKQAR